MTANLSYFEIGILVGLLSDHLKDEVYREIFDKLISAVKDKEPT